MDDVVPAENPFKMKAKPAPPPETDDGVAESDIHLTESPAPEEKVAPHRQMQGHKAQSVSPAKDAERGEEDAEAVQQWQRTTPAPPKKKRNPCVRFCVGCHGAIVSSPFASTIVLTVVAVVCFALFIVSCVFLKSNPASGSCGSCSGGPRNTGTCLTFGGSSDCGDACSRVSASPFRLVSTSTSLDAVYCAFPKLNSNWRIPLSLFATLSLLVTAFARCMKWRLTLFTNSLLLFVGGCMFFYVMIIDSAAVNDGQKLCDSFADATDDLACQLQGYAGVCVVDAILCVLVLYCSSIAFGGFRSIAATAKQAAAQKAKEPPSREKSRMFEKDVEAPETKPQF